MLQLLAPDGTYGVPKGYEKYGKLIEDLDEDTLKTFYRDMARIRRFDIEAIALQRQGHITGTVVVNRYRCLDRLRGNLDAVRIDHAVVAVVAG